MERTNLQDKTTDCGPATSTATEWGDWKGSKKEARKSARDSAREAAAEACAGECKEGEACVYLETAMEILETEVDEESNVLSFRSRARSSGRCKCEERKKPSSDKEKK